MSTTQGEGGSKQKDSLESFLIHFFKNLKIQFFNFQGDLAMSLE